MQCCLPWQKWAKADWISVSGLITWFFSEKYEIIKLYEYLCETTKFIYNNMIKDEPTLIFCENGNQKSATVIAAFLIKYGNHTKESAIKAIRTKYNSAFYPDINYNLSLEMFEKNY